jgi:hypothetical protein
MDNLMEKVNLLFAKVTRLEFAFLFTTVLMFLLFFYSRYGR